MTRDSISSSTSSGSLKPSRENTLTPLSWNELCENEITTPASARKLRVRKAIPGAGTGPTNTKSTPIAQMPEAVARVVSSKKEERCVDLQNHVFGWSVRGLSALESDLAFLWGVCVVLGYII